MLDYLLKSGGCLLVLYLFYVLFLEKENMHVYKRIYLLSIVVVSFIIPLVTFTNYVEVVEQIRPMIASGVVTEFPIIEEVEQQNYLSTVLWSIYGLGVLLFGMKFIKNSYEIVKKIKSNPKEKSGETTSVLLNEDIVPHTFFNFIFFNKQQFISHQIPKEVILHEETHARQKHSVDVLLLEFLQVVFWFNPVLFLLNRSVKLNHEFLADQAVLNNGANTKIYQQTLLAYSSNASQLQLAHSINYSSIKKRFTVMKTQTSKKKIWLRSFILLPVFALLLFSFSTTTNVEKENPLLNSIVDYNLTYDNFKKHAYIYHNDNDNDEILLNYVNAHRQLFNAFSSLTYQDQLKVRQPVDLPLGIKNKLKILSQKGITPKQVAEYNALAKKYNSQAQNKMDVKFQDVKRLEYLYKRMTSSQKKKAEKFPNFPPMPVPEVIEIVTDPKHKTTLPKVTEVVYDSHKSNSERPITFINGKTSCEGCVLELTKEKFSAIVLSIDKGEIISFKIKFPERPTVKVTNSTVLNKEAKTYLKEAKIGQMAQIFGLKSSDSKKHSSPVLFKIIK